MNTDPRAIIDFLLKHGFKKQNTELLKNIAKDIDTLCTKCQRDRIQCTLSPLCSRRFLLKLRIKSGAKLDDVPKFCYRQLVNLIARDKEKKRTLYRPIDSYIYLLDFFAIFFPKNYRSLFKNLSFRKYEEAIDVLESFKRKMKDDFRYFLTENYLIIEFYEKIYLSYLKEQYVCCNLRRDEISDLNLLENLILFLSTNYSHIIVERTPEDSILISLKVFKKKQTDLHKYFNEDIDENKSLFLKDIDIISDISNEIKIYFDESDNIDVKLNVKLKANINHEFFGKRQINYENIQNIFEFFNHLYKKELKEQKK